MSSTSVCTAPPQNHCLQAVNIHSEVILWVTVHLPTLPWPCVQMSPHQSSPPLIERVDTLLVPNPPHFTVSVPQPHLSPSVPVPQPHDRM